MKHILFFILFFTAVTVSAQTEFGTKFKPIPAPKFSTKKKTPIPQVKDPQAETADIPSIKTPNVFDNTSITPKSQLQVGAEKSKFTMSTENDFANPGDQYVAKMEKDLNKALKDAGLLEGRGTLVKSNISLGDFKTKSEYFIVKFRDFGAIDGDLVRVSSNDVVIKDQILLDSGYKDVKINLTQGFNKLDFEALNIGSLGGNTAEIRVYDDKGQLVTNDYWNNLAAGFRATIIVTKE
ncbi:hypothetical protein DBB36_09115 [Flavobacterium sp. WLB]|uniref:Secreted protein n=1 Tax=Flavobacterium panici TaxID=2654843 RepID=A0A9N8P425_9FLAO|nr:MULTISPECIES: hypothetical protein [Flavobacterium]KOP36045.1 hypothetical protein AKO67_21805 [Flavobacterium sp. VMW]OWU89397.1 hypothetical protein APR43_19590 [Flavobacterium sp. NLM]PUU70339.1 hypothetical protein DBB36_09115 [Flavobacterium sp. WLB]CAC9976742.1 hypothetical protein FLAPXU55_04470 [Flavobacterium panici]